MANELNDIIARVAGLDPAVGEAMREQVTTLIKLRPNGLNFERHIPEQVALAGRPISVGDKVRFIPERGSTKVEGDDPTWVVTKLTGPKGAKVAELLDRESGDTATRDADNLIYVADFRDPIYPGLVSTGRVERGGGKPFHSVINSENYHALEALTFTHAGKVDVIYIDPPYNTRAKDWKYNNDYVDPSDDYAHSMWLSFMERRLKVAENLLNPRDSVLLVTIDEKEYLRLGLLLEQTFPNARIQMVSIAINPSGQKRDGAFRRSDEYIFVVSFGAAEPTAMVLGPEWRAGRATSTVKIRWDGFLRSGTGAQREDSPLKFYPIIISKSGAFLRVGDPIPPDARREDYQGLGPDEVAVWPIRSDDSEGRWQTNVAGARKLRAKGFIRTGRYNGANTSISYLKAGEQSKLLQGVFGSYEIGEDGSVLVESESAQGNRAIPTTQWNLTAHSAADQGSSLLRSLIPKRRFPFPKSLYAVEDTLRFFVTNKPDALILDFFAGSGTTAHAVMRLNKQDGGRRQSISVTNNEVSANEQQDLIRAKRRAGDPEWEALGICNYITKPRIMAAATGHIYGDPDQRQIKGKYKRFVTRTYHLVHEGECTNVDAKPKKDGSPPKCRKTHRTHNLVTFEADWPMSDGFQENVEFFTLTYVNHKVVELDLAFTSIAPLLWMRAGSEGRRIDERGDTFEIADTYAVLFDMDASGTFLKEIDERAGLRVAYIVTDDEPQFQSIASQLPEGIESVRLYETYLRTFTINTEGV
ncbi:MAG: DNA methyltransferase [Ornithinimicrobium sp.]